MALITDPDQLTQGTEIVINTTALTIQLIVTGNLSNDGVTGQAFYSFLKEEWNSDSSLIPYDFPMVSITPEQFEFIKGWKPADDTTRFLLRFVGWRELDTAANSNALNQEFMNVITLGSGSNTIDSTDRAYYAFAGDTAKTDFSFNGPVNQGIQTMGDSTHGNFDKRALVLSTFIRTQGKTYGDSTSSSIGLSALNYIANRFPLSESANSKIVDTDATISANGAPYSGMSITFSSEQRLIGGVGFDFDIIINGNSASAEKIYSFVQYKLRLTTDIDASSSGQIGNLTRQLLNFVGDELITSKGVYIDNINLADNNRITFTDVDGNIGKNPFIAAGVLEFNPNCVSDTDTKFFMFFSDTFGTTGATLVKDVDTANITGSVSGNAAIGFTFDYDGNVQQGRSITPAADVGVTVVAVGLNGAQYVTATATIGRASGQKISLVAPLERNYSNPA